MKYRNLQLILGLLIAVVALYFTFRNVSFLEIFESIKNLKVVYLPLAAFLFFAGFAIRAYRWHFLCKSVKPIPTMRLFSPMMIGFMGNLLPLRAGEFIRAYLLGKKEEIGFSSSFATIVVERIFDMFSILVLFAGLLAFNPTLFVPRGGGGDPTQVAGYVRSFGVMSIVGVLILVAFCYFLVHQQEKALSLVRFFTRILPHRFQKKIEELLKSFTEGLGILRDPKGIAISVVLSAILWVVLVFVNYPLYFSYQIEWLPLSSMVTVLVVTCVLIAVMPTPGYLGPFQFAATFVLADLYGVDKSVAASFSLVTWFLQMGLVFLSGIFFLVRDNISFMEVSRDAKEMAETGGDQSIPG